MNILITDDSKAMRSLITYYLTQAGFTGHNIIEAANGKEALKIIFSKKVDLILSDWNMPEMMGIEFLQELKKLVEHEKLEVMIPFVFITSECTVEMREKASLAGAMDFITKPFIVDDFKFKLAPILEEKK